VTDDAQPLLRRFDGHNCSIGKFPTYPKTEGVGLNSRVNFKQHAALITINQLAEYHQVTLRLGCENVQAAHCE